MYCRSAGADFQEQRVPLIDHGPLVSYNAYQPAHRKTVSALIK
jgi:hypothetical protein